MLSLAEAYEYEAILQQMLGQVPDSIDKREGSVIYHTLAPVAFALAQQSYMLAYMTDLLLQTRPKRNGLIELHQISELTGSRLRRPCGRSIPLTAPACRWLYRSAANLQSMIYRLL